MVLAGASCAGYVVCMPRIFVTQYFDVDVVHKTKFTVGDFVSNNKPKPVEVEAIIVDASGVQFDLKKHELEAYEAAIKKLKNVKIVKHSMLGPNVCIYDEESAIKCLEKMNEEEFLCR